MHELLRHHRDDGEVQPARPPGSAQGQAVLATVDGLDIHFLHIRSANPAARPLVLTHGWPGSVIEFMGVVEALANPPAGEQAFHVVAPSLPGFDEAWLM